MQPVEIHLHDPSPEAVTAAVSYGQQRTAEPSIRVVERDGGVVLDVPGPLRELLIQFGWMPPVDVDEVD